MTELNPILSNGYSDLPVTELQFPRELLGRKIEQNVLSDFLKVQKDGSDSVLFVSGDAGIGKTFLLKNYFKQESDLRAYFGEHDLFRKGVPFLGLSHILADILRAILRMSEDEKIAWRNTFIDKFGDKISDLYLIVPSISEILDVQIELNPVIASAVSIQNRISHILIDFISFLLQSVEGEVVFVLENLQWADDESFFILSELIKKNFHNLFMVLTSRAKSDLKLEILFENESAANLIELPLDPLDLPTFSAILEKTFKTSNNIQELAEIAFKQCEGNPSILQEYIGEMRRSKHILESSSGNGWEWHVSENEAFLIEPTFTKLLTEKLAQLEPLDKEVLQASACFGAKLNVPLISKVCNFSQDDILEVYKRAVGNGILGVDLRHAEDLKNDQNNFEFSSSAVQEAIHESLKSSVKEGIHKKNVDYYVNSSVIGLDERVVYECAYHINEAISDESSFEDKLLHAEVNLRALEKAKSTASFSVALKYLHEAMDSNLHHNWTTAYHLSSKLRIQGFQIARLTNNEMLANKLYLEGIEKCKLKEKAQLRLAKIALDVQFGKLEDSLANGIEGLRELGVSVPKKAILLDVGKEFLKTKLKLGTKKPEDIFNLPAMKDENAELAVRMMYWMFKSAYYVNPELSAVLSLKLMQLTLKKGTNGDSFIGLMAYGIISTAGNNDYYKAYEYCEVGSRLAEKYNNESSTYFFGKAVYSAYKLHLRDTLPFYSRAIENGFDDGEFISSAEPTVNESLTSFSAGFSLAEVENKVFQNLTFCQDLKMKDYRDFQLVFLDQIKLLQGKKSQKSDLVEIQEILRSTQYKFTVSVYKFMEIQRACLESDWKKAYELSEKFKPEVQSLTGLYIQAEFYFYCSLAALKCLRNVNLKDKLKIKREVKSVIKKMKKWADSCPDNHQHKLLLIEGILEQSKGNFAEAKMKLSKAADAAKEMRFTQNAAIANAFLAGLYADERDERNAQVFRKKSTELFKEWGTSLVG